MKLRSTDFPRLQLSLLIALLMIAVGAAAVYAGIRFYQGATIEKSAALAERNEFDSKLKRVRSEENEIKLKTSIFKTLQAQGIIGNEHRLEWVKLLKSVHETRQLIDLQYEIAPQRRLDADTGYGLAFFASTMKVQLKLLHEEDLTRFIGDLRRNAPALIRIRNCDVSRQMRDNAGKA